MKHLQSIYAESPVEYIEQGSGEVLVLLHGLFGNLTNFRETVAHFAAKYRVIVPFLPLYTLPLRSSNLSGMLEFLEQLLEDLKITSCTLLGNSLGGHLALIYALKHPEKLQGLILTGSSGLFEKAFGEALPRRSDYDYIKTKTEQTFFNPICASKELVDEVFEVVNNRDKALRVLSLAKSAMRHNLRSELARLKMPVLLIWGKNDTITPAFVAEEFHKLIPQSQLQWIEECGHAAMMEQPDLFNKLLERFMRSITQTV